VWTSGKTGKDFVFFSWEGGFEGGNENKAENLFFANSFTKCNAS
jgi:hypothetical protein